MASLIPSFVKKEVVDVWVAETMKLMLLNNTHTPNAITQRYVSDVVAKEVTSSGAYVAGGPTLARKIAVANGDNYYLDASDQVIGPLMTLNYRYGILYKDTGNPATSPIRAHIDFTDDQVVTNGTSTIQWNALGIIYVS